MAKIVRGRKGRGVGKPVCFSLIVLKRKSGPGTISRAELRRLDPRFRDVKEGEKVTICK